MIDPEKLTGGLRHARARYLDLIHMTFGHSRTCVCRLCNELDRRRENLGVPQPEWRPRWREGTP